MAGGKVFLFAITYISISSNKVSVRTNVDFPMKNNDCEKIQEKNIIDGKFISTTTENFSHEVELQELILRRGIQFQEPSRSVR